ncbi:MAG: GFA family protein [Pseudomonadota bacterium]
MKDNEHQASCLCGAIKISVAGDLPEGDACHCSQCRKQSGHVWASVDLPPDRVSIAGEENVRWYQSSEKVRRGFCQTCGSFLFWDASTRDDIAIAMGAFDNPTGTRLWSHIHVADKGDYYELGDGILQKD